MDLAQNQHQEKESALGIGRLAPLLQKLRIPLYRPALLGRQLHDQAIIAKKPVTVQKIFGNLLDKLLVKIDAVADIALLGGVVGVNIMIRSRAVQNKGRGGDFLAVSIVKDLSLGVACHQKQLGEVVHMGVLVGIVEPLGDPLNADGALLGRISELRFVWHLESSLHDLPLL